MTDLLTQPLTAADPVVQAAVDAELHRQRSGLEMIASENFAPVAVLQAQGSTLTNKYSEGYPGRRYYGGCEHVDMIEQIAIDRARELFGADHANVQPHSGAQANAAALSALLRPGDTILGLDLAHGGHLTHGARMNFSGKLYRAVAYHVSRDAGRVDMAEVAALARRHRPQAIIAGWSAYPRHLDFGEFRRIADEAAVPLVVDMAHFGGLVAAGLHPSPVPYADVVTTTTHKTLGGARGGLILCRAEHAKAIDAAVFPGQQGGALNQAIAGKAVTLRMAGTRQFADRQRRTIEGARILAVRLMRSDAATAGIRVLTGGTDVHLVLLDLSGTLTDGYAAEQRLQNIGVTVNRNTVPFDPRPAIRPSGLRIGTSALATRGFAAEAFEEVADIIAAALSAGFDDSAAGVLRERVAKLAAAHPLYAGALG